MSRDDHFRQMLDELPAAIYTTDPDGRITYFNNAAVALWGHRPELGKSEWCGSWKLFWPDGRALPHGDCPMAIAIKEKRAIRGMEAVAERPDGSRVPFLPFPTPLFDTSGELVGAVNMLVDISNSKRADDVAQRLAAIVASSEDAIISKDLTGAITSWNAGAERLFGYTAQEAIGRNVTMLIPADRQDEEPAILARLRRGERIDHYETIRQRKDGTLVDISLTVSPLRDHLGATIGASKIARDITERRRAQEQQQLLVREMAHRTRNLFALAGSVVALSVRTATTPQELAAAVRRRLAALARAQDLTLPKTSVETAQTEERPTLHALIATIISPYEAEVEGARGRVVVTGDDVPLSGGALTSFALLLQEFATNAAKYGALSTPTGRIDVRCEKQAGQFDLTWTECGGPRIEGAPGSEGFGSLLARMTVQNQFKGEFTREWKPEGLTIRLSVPRDRLTV